MKTMTKMKSWLLMIPLILLSGCSNESWNQNRVSPANKNVQESRQDDSYYQSSSKSMASKISDAESSDTVYFDFNQYDVNSKYSTLLNEYANALNSSINTVITIEGHADERGTSEYNIALGEKRANAVRDYLQSRGVSSQQMNIVSFGKEKPAVLGHTEAVYEKNRRAVLVY